MIQTSIEEEVQNLKDIDSIFELFEFLGYKEHLLIKPIQEIKSILAFQKILSLL